MQSVWQRFQLICGLPEFGIIRNIECIVSIVKSSGNVARYASARLAEVIQELADSLKYRILWKTGLHLCYLCLEPKAEELQRWFKDILIYLILKELKMIQLD